MDMLLVCENLFSSAFTDMMLVDVISVSFGLVNSIGSACTTRPDEKQQQRMQALHNSTSRLKNQYAGANVSATSITLMVLMGYKKKRHDSVA
jgi:hypothetical protein